MMEWTRVRYSPACHVSRNGSRQGKVIGVGDVEQLHHSLAHSPVTCDKKELIGRGPHLIFPHRATAG